MTEASSIDPPFVSVVIPVFNMEAWIVETVESVLAQDHEAFEVIIVNDGSTDSTAELLAELARRDARIRVVDQANGGLSAARNRGIRESQAKYIAIVDGDDLWRPTKLAKQVDCYEQAEAVGERLGFVYCWSNSIDEAGRLLRPGLSRDYIAGEVFDELLANNFVGNGSVQMFHRERLISTALYAEEMRKGCEDWAVSLQLARRFPCAVVPEFLVGYRQLSDSMSRDIHKMKQAHAEMIELIERNGSALSQEQIRASRNAIYLWLLLLAFTGRDLRECSKTCKSLFANDWLFVFRQRSMRLIYQLFRAKLQTLLGRQKPQEAAHFLEMPR